jgi:NAD(P)-dependent dehydrogenase (short-subunit alcohol dehydrogenase family)
MNFDDLQGERSYSRWRAYGQSKLANLLFMYELQRRSDAAGTPLRSLAAHPGYAATNLQSHSGNAAEVAVMRIMNKVVAQSEAMGALPSLYAATQELPGGTYIGPDGIAEGRGHPKVVGSTGAARDKQAAARLWQVSEELTGVTYAWPAVTA